MTRRKHLRPRRALAEWCGWAMTVAGPGDGPALTIAQFISLVRWTWPAFARSRPRKLRVDRDALCRAAEAEFLAVIAVHQPGYAPEILPQIIFPQPIARVLRMIRLNTRTRKIKGPAPLPEKE